jgi:hypothetical protein
MDELSLDDFGQAMWPLFQSALEAASYPDYCDTTSEGVFPGLAWEIYYDLTSYTDGFVPSLQNYLTTDELAAISQYLDATRTLPEEIFAKRGIGPGFGVLHPAWDEQRLRSIELLRKFEPRLRETWAKLEWDTQWFDQWP